MEFKCLVGVQILTERSYSTNYFHTKSPKMRFTYF